MEASRSGMSLFGHDFPYEAMISLICVGYCCTSFPTAQYSPPPSKCTKVVTNACLLYFGRRFAWYECELQAQRRIPYTVLMDRLMQREIKEDVERLSYGGFPKNYSVEEETCFMRVGESNIWVYQHNVHCACSEVKFEYFWNSCDITQATLIPGRGECNFKNGRHVALLPFFRDNLSLLRTYKELEPTPLKMSSELDNLLRQPDVTDVPEYFYTGGAPVNTKGNMFSENVWSTRLAGALKQFLPEKYQELVRVTCHFGPQFKSRQQTFTGLPPNLCSCYPFQGSPDIVIQGQPLMLCEQEEEMSENTIFENSLQAVKQTEEFPPKLGELVANMHVALVKKILKTFIKGGPNKVNELTFRGSGLLLQKANGGILCEAKVSLKKNMATPFQVTVDDFVCQTLTPEALCLQLQKFLNLKDIHLNR